jgi:hypothetical protein
VWPESVITIFLRSSCGGSPSGSGKREGLVWRLDMGVQLRC